MSEGKEGEGWRVEIIAPNGNWWGSAYGRTVKELKRNTEDLLLKLEKMAEIGRNE